MPSKEKLLPACAEHDVALVAMKVYGGGSLLRDQSAVELQDFPMGRQEMPGAPLHYELTVEVRASYAELESDASDCIACGQCSERCPFGVDVIAKMREAVDLFA